MVLAVSVVLVVGLVVGVVVRQATAVVDCRVACRRCRQATDPAELVEVYCAMCAECKERRIERMQTAAAAVTTTTSGRDDCDDGVQEVTDCPEQPSCEEDTEAPTIVPLYKTVKTTTTSTTTPAPTTTTKRVCPRLPCKRPVPPPCFCMPWQPVALCPCPAPPLTTEPPQKLRPPTDNEDYVYVYVGVPKNLLD